MMPSGRWRPRVYTTVVVLLAVVLLGWWIASPVARGQVDVSIEPAMTRGPMTARVTIFEFSDYE